MRRRIAGTHHSQKKCNDMKLLYSLMFLLLATNLFAQGSAKSKNKNSVSAFADFEQLGMQKSIFIEKFGSPMAKDMSYDKDKNKVEALYYVEFLEKGKFVLSTKFVFKNNTLEEWKCTPLSTYSIQQEMLDKIYRDLELIYFRRK